MLLKKRVNIVLRGDCIVSPLGVTTGGNIAAIKRGESALGRVDSPFGLEGDFVIGRIDDQMLAAAPSGFSRLERMMVMAVEGAVKEGIDASSADTVFIFATTKGNIALLEREDPGSEELKLWHSARVVAEYFHNPNEPVVISNACISGVVAQIVAKRLLEAGLYKRAVVIGADEVTRFTLAGFNALKALSPEVCRPFSPDRKGLNLGEAAGALILEALTDQDIAAMHLHEVQVVMAGAITNDANHISGPSRTGEGLLRAITKVCEASPLGGSNGFINPHGTATLYNDQMESIAIERASLGSLPLLPLKRFYGHTLASSGLIETILSSHFMQEGRLPQIPDYHEERDYKADWFIKMASGFGGCNAVIKIGRHKVAMPEEGQGAHHRDSGLYIQKSIRIACENNVHSYFTALYKELQAGWPKFYKMDLLCKGGILAMQQLLGEPSEAQTDADSPDDTTALVFINSSSSLAADRDFQQTIKADDFFPSPALFVYTLPSIVIGEIAIRYKFYGEGTFFVSESFNANYIIAYLRQLFAEGAAQRAVLCWSEVTAEKCRLHAMLITPQQKEGRCELSPACLTF